MLTAPHAPQVLYLFLRCLVFSRFSARFAYLFPPSPPAAALAALSSAVASSLSARGIHSLLMGLYTMFFLKLEGSSSTLAPSSGFVQPPACGAPHSTR